jgi:hypothetical protein
MRFLWFSEGVSGAVTMYSRGNPKDWSESVQANTLVAIIDLMQELMTDMDVDVAETTDSDNVIPFTQTKRKL